MCVRRCIGFILLLFLCGFELSIGSEDGSHPQSVHRLHSHKVDRRHRAVNDGGLRFEPEPYSKKLELNSSGKIHCKVAGGVAPVVTWYLNEADPLPEGITSANGTLLVTAASRRHTGRYTCRAVEDEHKIEADIHLDIVVSPRVLEPAVGQQLHATIGQTVALICRATGDPPPTIHWDRNRTVLQQQQEGVEIEGGQNSTIAKFLLLNNGTLVIREVAPPDADQYGCTAGSAAGLARNELQLIVHKGRRLLNNGTLVIREVAPPDADQYGCTAGSAAGLARNELQLIVHKGRRLLNNGTLVIREVAPPDADQYGCTAGSAAGLARNELQLIVHKEGEMPPSESGGVAGKAVVVSVSVAGAYMLLVLALMVYCRRRRLQRRQAGEKLELEMVEGREKLVEEGEEEKKVGNGVPAQNGRLLPHDRDSGADNSEVSGVSRASKKSGQFDQLAVPRSLLTELIPLGRGEFGEVSLSKIDIHQVKKLRSKGGGEDGGVEPKMRPVLVKALTTKDEVQLAEFRRQLELFSRVRHESVARLVGLCNEADPHYMLLEHTDWGDLKNFLTATRTPAESEEYLSRAGPALPPPAPRDPAPPLGPQHQALLVLHLATAGGKLAAKRITHRDIAARNCLITSRLHLKLSYPALTRGPDSHEYYKLHDQVIPLRWLPLEAVAEGEYSTKCDVYMFAATVWEIYTKAELPFTKLNDSSVLERLRAGTLEWRTPGGMPEPLARLLSRCWSRSPADRPQFAQICEEMAAILKEVTSENVSQVSQERIDEC